MATYEDLERLASAMPETSVTTRWGNRTWCVGGKGFAWERPFSKADIKRFGDRTPPDGPIAAIRTVDMMEKAAILATASKAVFDIEHFRGYPGLLIQLNAVEHEELQELVTDAWLACAPPALAEVYLREHSPNAAAGQSER